MLRLSKKSKESALSTFAKRRPIATTMLCLGVFGLCIGGVTTGLVYGLKKDDAFTNQYKVDSSTMTKIDDIWSNNGYFNPARFNKLLTAISNGTASYSDLSSLESAAEETKTATDLKNNNPDGKKEIVVTFGGFDWTPTYLSKTADGKDTILTLWMTNNEQDAYKGLSQNAGKYYGFVKSETTGKTGLYSDWSADWSADRPQDAFPSNMYGTSYIRTVTLNNGGRYVTKQQAAEADLVSVEKDENNIFAKFTMEDADGSVASYLVEPARVQWQEYGQNIKSQFGTSFSYSAPNENWSTEIPDDGVYNGETYKFDTSNGAYYNYAQKTDADAWANDKLWLPSWTETGYSSSKVGLWQTSTDQRKNYDGSTTSFSTESGTKIGTDNSSYSTTAYTYSWLRSGSYSYSYACSLIPSGSDYYNYYVNFSCAVRPALHLSLTSAALSAASAPYEISNAKELEEVAGLINNPATHDEYASKTYVQTADIRLGGTEWTPIGTSANPFTGHYNGNGYKIEGITINSTNEDASLGLFGKVANGGKIENVTMEGGNIQGGDSTGSIAGWLEDSEITNCKSNVNIVGGCDSGGIVGCACYGDMTEYGNSATFKTIISNCYFSGGVTADGVDGLGGIVGIMSCAILKNSIFDGAISGTNSVIGGLIGWAEEGYAIVSDCISKGTISKEGSRYVGSLGGSLPNSSISNCAAYDYIFTDNLQETGALVGNGGGSVITGCSFSGNCNSDGIAPFAAWSDEDTQITACYVWLNNDVKVYSDDTSDWAEYYGLAGSMNDGLPMQRSLFAIASVSPATTQDILAVLSQDNGWTKYEAA